MLIKDINFFDRYKESQKRSGSISKETTTRVAICGGVALAFFLVSGGMGAYTLAQQQEIDRINEYIQSSEVQEKLTQLAAKQQVLDNSTQYYKAIELANSKITTKVRFNQQMLDEIMKLKPANMTIDILSLNETSLAMNCASSSEPDITTFIHRLLAIPFVHKATYGGFSETDGKYATSITIAFKEGGTSHELNQ